MSVVVEDRRSSRRTVLVRPESARARSWNQTIRAVVRADTAEELPFFCECGVDGCEGRAWLTLQEARAIIERGGRIIGPHVPGELEARRV